MSQPQFPDPLGRRELLRPGATAHKAGLSLEDRVKAMEQGAAGRPGPGVANGSVLTSDTTQTGGAKWSLPGSPVWTTVAHVAGLCNAIPGATTRWFLASGAVNSGAGNAFIFPLDPADYAVTGRTAQLRMVAVATCNDTGSGTGLTTRLQQVTASTGAASAVTYTATGRATCDFSGASTPGANNIYNRVVSGPTTLDSTNFPAATYFFTVTTGGGAMTANSTVQIGIQVQVRHI